MRSAIWDDILCKVDRASMAVSLEVHCPFLDHRVAELAARIPMSMKIRGSVGKHLLREMLFREAPRKLFERPKSGFGGSCWRMDQGTASRLGGIAAGFAPAAFPRLGRCRVG